MSIVNTKAGYLNTDHVVSMHDVGGNTWEANMSDGRVLILSGEDASRIERISTASSYAVETGLIEVRNALCDVAKAIYEAADTTKQNQHTDGRRISGVQRVARPADKRFEVGSGTGSGEVLKPLQPLLWPADGMRKNLDASINAAFSRF